VNKTCDFHLIQKTFHNQIAKDQRARSSKPSRTVAAEVLDARRWTRLVHLSQARKRFFEILVRPRLPGCRAYELPHLSLAISGEQFVRPQSQ
jgi:hypothetical protein